MVEKIMKPGVWLRRGDRLAVAVQFDPHRDYCQWRGSDGRSRYDDGRFYADRDSEWDLVEWVDVPEKPQQQPQPDAAGEAAWVKENADLREKLAEIRDDRDKWQARAVQAEGRCTTLARDVFAVGAERDEAQKQLTTAQIQLREAKQQLTTAQGVIACQSQRWGELQQQLANYGRQVSDLQAQLEAAVHAPDLRGEVERVAAERDAAREEVRGLQVRAEQAEGDARQATAKMRHLEREAARWQAQAEVKNNTMLKAEGAVNALQVVIMNLVREVANHDD